VSTTVFVEFARRVRIRQWESFCGGQALEFCPNRIGYNGYYSPDRVAELNLNREGTGPTGQTPRGLPDFATSAPPGWFSKLDVGTVYIEKPENLELVARIALAIVDAFGETHGAHIVEADERLEPYLGIVWV